MAETKSTYQVETGESAEDQMIRDIIFSPAEAATAFIDYAGQLQEAPKVTWGVKAIDEKIIPLHPGDLVSLIGRPGSAKTSLLIYMARREAMRIYKAGEEGSCVIYVTWEQSVPELEAMIEADDETKLDDIAWGRADINRLVTKVQYRASLPIWIIGLGLGSAGLGRTEMTPEIVFRAIDKLASGEIYGPDMKIKPTLMCFDYVQLIPPDSTGSYQKWERVYEAVNQCKRLAVRVGCPVLVAAQAGREVDNFKEKIPQLGSGQMSSAIEQASDKVVGLCRPWTYGGWEIVDTADGREFKVTDKLLLMRIVKQRMAAPGFTFHLMFDPATFRLGEAQPNF